MEYRNLGRTGVKVSSLCLGTMMFGRSANESDSIAIVHAALEKGINFVDTANAYSAGASERFVGTALQGGRRASVVLARRVSSQVSRAISSVPRMLNPASGLRP